MADVFTRYFPFSTFGATFFTIIFGVIFATTCFVTTFFVTTFFVCVILFHIIKILRSIRKIVDRVEEGSEVIAEDVSQLRTYVVGGSLVSHIMSFVFGAGAKSASRARRKNKEE